MSFSIADLLSESSPFAAPASASASAAASGSSFSALHHVNLSDVDFDWVENCSSPQQLQSVISQLESEAFPDLLRAARQRLQALDPEKQREAERKRREGEDRAASLHELLQWAGEAKQQEQKVQTTASAPRRVDAPVRGRSEKAAAETQARTAAAAADIREVAVLTAQERAQRLQSERQKGNESYRARDYDAAAQHYAAAIRLLPSAPQAEDWTLHSNLAISCIRLGRYDSAIDAASEAITGSGGECVKAWWRRGQAQEALGRTEEASRDLTEAWRRADGKLKEEIQKDLQRCEEAVSQQQQEEGKRAEEQKQKSDADELPKPMRRVPVQADSDSEAESEDETAASPSRPAPPRPVFSAPRGGMTIEVLEDEQEEKEEEEEGQQRAERVSSYAQFERRFLSLTGRGSRRRWLRRIPLSDWSRVLSSGCQLSREALQAIIAVWAETADEDETRLLQEMETVSRVERLSLMLQMISAEARQQLTAVMTRLETQRRVDLSRLQALRLH